MLLFNSEKIIKNIEPLWPSYSRFNTSNRERRVVDIASHDLIVGIMLHKKSLLQYERRV